MQRIHFFGPKSQDFLAVLCFVSDVGDKKTQSKKINVRDKVGFQTAHTTLCLAAWSKRNNGTGDLSFKQDENVKVVHSGSTDLVNSAENVSVVLLESAHSSQTGQSSGQLVPVQHSEVRHSDGQLLPRPRPVVKHQTESRNIIFNDRLRWKLKTCFL